MCGCPVRLRNLKKCEAISAGGIAFILFWDTVSNLSK